MHAQRAETVKDECYRCGYDIRGIAGDSACPECGLLAERSRRVNDELHNTRPGWLLGLFWGTNLILLAIVVPFVWIWCIGFPRPVKQTLMPRIPIHPTWWLNFLILLDVSAALLFVGIFLLTRPEGYSPADQGDRNLRRGLRCLSLAPLLAVANAHFFYTMIDSAFSPQYLHDLLYETSQDNSLMLLLVMAFATIIGLLPFLPAVLMLRLRGLAKRAHSAHLGEHCLIVGVGASFTLLVITAAILPIQFILDERDSFWWSHLWFAPILIVWGSLFWVWAIYLMARFALAFHMARRKLRQTWRRDDRSALARPGARYGS